MRNRAAKLDVLRLKGTVESATANVVNPPKRDVVPTSALTRITEMSRNGAAAH